jgi:hypothetical protein
METAAADDKKTLNALAKQEQTTQSSLHSMKSEHIH